MWTNVHGDLVCREIDTGWTFGASNKARSQVIKTIHDQLNMFVVSD